MAYSISFDWYVCEDFRAEWYLIIVIVVDYRDNDSIQLYHCDILDLFMLCQKHE